MLYGEDEVARLDLGHQLIQSSRQHTIGRNDLGYHHGAWLPIGGGSISGPGASCCVREVSSITEQGWQYTSEKTVRVIVVIEPPCLPKGEHRCCKQTHVSSMLRRMSRSPRLAVYGVGRYGSAFVRLAQGKGWPVVAAFNRPGDKVGRDLGEVAGIDDDLGVAVEDCHSADYSRLRELGVDVAVVATSDRLPDNMEGYERLLSAGVNVLSHGTESYFPRIRPDYADRIQELASANGVTFTGSGIWDVSRIWSGVLAAGPCAEITALHHTSRTELGRSSIAPVVGIGLSHDEFQRRMIDRPGPVGELYKIIPWQVMVALGFDVTTVTERREPVLFEHPVHSTGIGRDIPAGEPAGVRITVDVESSQGTSAHATIELRVCLEHETEDFMAWRVTGSPNSGVHVDRQIGHQGSAVALLNRVHDVIAAAPGIQEIYRLGPPRHTALGAPS